MSTKTEAAVPSESNDIDHSLESNSESQQFLTFSVGEEEYGVELMTIREIKGWTDPTHLPNSPNFMKGVINLRGAVIPIFDLRHRFAMGETNANEKNVVIIIAVEQKLIGILVDAVSDIVEVTKDKIRPAPKVDSKIDEDFIDGLISVDDKMVVILNIDHLFDPETLSQINIETSGLQIGGGATDVVNSVQESASEEPKDSEE